MSQYNKVIVQKEKHYCTKKKTSRFIMHMYSMQNLVLLFNVQFILCSKCIHLNIIKQLDIALFFCPHMCPPEKSVASPWPL